MTVTSLNNRVDVYADGVQTAFNFSGFKVVNTNHLKVYLDGELQNSGYTVTLLPTLLGGTVTFTTAPADDVLVTLYREVPLTQETNLGIESDLSERSIENMSDKLTMGLQQLNEKIQRSLTLPISSNIQGLELPSPDAGMFLRWNATESALENADINITGGGVAGPSSSIQYAVAVFNSTTGLLIDDVDSTGVAGQALISNGPGAKPSFQDIVFPTPPANDGFGGNGSRQIPTSGNVSGDYHHSGDLVATGAWTIADGTRFFVKNCTNFDPGAYNHVVSTRSNSGGQGRPTSGNNKANIGVGSGPGSAPIGGGTAITVASAPGGPGFGGRGGRGGSYSDHYMPGGSCYSPRNFFGGTGGNSGMHYNSTVAAPDGGNAGGAFYLEVEMISGTCKLGNFNLNGQAGTDAPSTYGASAGGTGGCFIARIRGTAQLPAGRTISANGGAGGGTAGVGYAAAGGAGGGVIDIQATSWTNNGIIQANGGAAGSGGSYAATAGSAGLVNAEGLDYNPSKFF